MQPRHLDPNVIQLCIIVWMDVNCPIYEFLINTVWVGEPLGGGVGGVEDHRVL